MLVAPLCARAGDVVGTTFEVAGAGLLFRDRPKKPRMRSRLRGIFKFVAGVTWVTDDNPDEPACHKEALRCWTWVSRSIPRNRSRLRHKELRGWGLISSDNG